MCCDESQGLTLEAKNGGMGGPAEACGTLGHDVHDRLEVGRRAGDDSQDLGGGGLLLEGLGQLAISGLELREQADVLDGDDRLVSEGFRQLDLLVGECLYLAPSQGDDADWNPFAQEWRGEQRPSRESGPTLAFHRSWVLLLSQRYVLDLDRLAIMHCSPSHTRESQDDTPTNRYWHWNETMLRDESEGLAFQAVDRGIGRAAEPRCTHSHDVHHGLEIGRGAGDDPQDLRGGRLLLEGLGQLAVPGLELREEPYVFDGDDRLIGEGLRQRDLFIRERPYLRAAHDDPAEWYAFA